VVFMKEHWPSNSITEYSFKRFEINSFSLRHSNHIREFHILISIRSGLAKFCFGDKTEILCSGQSIILKAGELLSLVPLSSTISISLHHIDPIDVIEAADGLQLPCTESLLAQIDIIHAHANSLFNPIEIDISRGSYLKWLKNLITDLNKYNPTKEFTRVSNTHIERITTLRDHILAGLDCPYNLNILAKDFQIDKWNLSKSIRPVLGLTLQQQYHAAKIAEARKLLTSTTDHSEIAYQLGYSDQSHFIRFFKRHTGTTPKKWSIYASQRFIDSA